MSQEAQMVGLTIGELRMIIKDLSDDTHVFIADSIRAPTAAGDAEICKFRRGEEEPYYFTENYNGELVELDAPILLIE